MIKSPNSIITITFVCFWLALLIMGLRIDSLNKRVTELEATVDFHNGRLNNLEGAD